MKWLPLILSSILLFSGLRPWDGGAICLELQAGEIEACHGEEKARDCCQTPIADEPGPTKEEPCSGGCHCYCCSSIIASAAIAPRLSFPEQASQQDRWVPSLYDHDFTHLIWHPPQLG